MNTFHRYSRVFAAAALCALGSTGAYAQASWDLDACVRNGGTSCNASGASLTTSVAVSGYYATGATNKFALGTLNTGADWMGIGSASENTTDPNHSIDNITSSGSPYELVYLQFSRAVDLSNITAVWTGGTGYDADFQLWRWNGSGAPTVTDYQPNAAATPGTAGSGMTGWTSVTVSTGDFEGALSQTISDGTYYSSYWLVSTAFGGSNDAFKLGSLTAATAVCSGGANGSGGCAPSVSVPEPASIAMVLLAGVAATSVRRRRRA
jgi:hypothetical protein